MYEALVVCVCVCVCVCVRALVSERERERERENTEGNSEESEVFCNYLKRKGRVNLMYLRWWATHLDL